MKLDFATLAFGFSLKVGGGTPNWSTSLGQNKEYKINDIEGIDELLKGLVYKSQSPEKISTKIGKGGKSHTGNEDNSPIVLGSVFTNVMINNIKIENGKFILLITRDTSESHFGRLKLKYGPTNTFTDGESSYNNELFYNQVYKQLNLSDNACWFVSDISIENQDVLKLKAIIVNSNKSVEYQNTDELHKAWGELEPCLLEDSSSSTFIQNHDQTIYYGVPGSGKSHKIDEITKSLPEEQTIRVVFHPEYTNADFVGQILPHVENTVDYRFKAGPFSRILKKAYENPTKPYFLVIEEINRGNAAAIFGDFFQLLDRDSDGWSSYSVENLDINAFIRSNDSTYTDKYSDIPTTKEIGNTTWTENTGIRLPPNLSILASMNTSDQNVFTLDNAFQRRWDMKLVENTFEHEGASLEDVQNDNIQKNAKITVANQTITWGNFQSKINEIIGNAANESGFSSMEDKRLGCWFIKNEKGIIDIEKFANKVLKYLWDDAFKFNRTEFFGDIKNFEDLKKDFASKGFSIFNIEDFVFESNDNSFAETQSDETTEN